MADVLLHILAVLAAMAISAGIATPVFVWIWKWQLRQEGRSGWFSVYAMIASATLAFATTMIPLGISSILIETYIPGPLDRGWIGIACLATTVISISIPYYRRYRLLILEMNARAIRRKREG